MGDSYATRLLRLAFLSPDIVTGILAGTHPSGLTVRKLMDDTRLPLDWAARGESMGFAGRLRPQEYPEHDGAAADRAVTRVIRRDRESAVE